MSKPFRRVVTGHDVNGKSILLIEDNAPHSVSRGAAGVVVCARNSAPLSPAVSKASAGAMELLPVHEAGNLPSFLEASAGNGWAVLGADAGNGALNVAGIRVGGPTLLVLGSEGGGCAPTCAAPARSSSASPASRRAARSPTALRAWTRSTSAWRPASCSPPSSGPLAVLSSVIDSCCCSLEWTP